MISIRATGLVLAFNSPTDPILAAAFWAGLASLALTLLLGLQIIFMRYRLRYLQRLQQATVARWRPVLHGAIVGEQPAQLPPLKPNERLPFLRLWVYIHESLRGDAGEALNDIAHRLQCDDIARALLRSGQRTEKLLAVLVLGLLRDQASARPLRHLATLPDSAVSIYAYWALVRIDPASAVDEDMMRLLTRREDWPVTRLVLILQEMPEQCPAAFDRALRAADERDVLRLLRIAHALRLTLAADILAGLLAHASIEVQLAALKLVQSPQLLEQISAAVAAEDWRVRMQAAAALGRIGGADEVAALVGLLGDEQWWVRYRAAHALLALPFVKQADIERVRASLSDRFAVDILTHALHEKGRA